MEPQVEKPVLPVSAANEKDERIAQLQQQVSKAESFAQDRRGMNMNACKHDVAEDVCIMLHHFGAHVGLEQDLERTKDELQTELRRLQTSAQDLERQKEALQGELETIKASSKDLQDAKGGADAELLRLRGRTSRQGKDESRTGYSQERACSGTVQRTDGATRSQQDGGIIEGSSPKQAVVSLDLQQELEKLKAVSSSEASERKTLEAQIASLEAQLKNVKSEDGAAQALRQQVTKLEEDLFFAPVAGCEHQELAQLRAKHLQAASDQAAKISASEAKALDADARCIAPLQEAQLAESELLMTKTRLADAETQLSRAHQEMAKREGDVATQRAAAQASALELAARVEDMQQTSLYNMVIFMFLFRHPFPPEPGAADRQGETASEGETLRSEVRNLLAEVKEKEQMQIKVAELTAQLSQGRSSQALLETSTADAKEQLRGVRAELTEQRALAAEDARRLRSELWEERSAAASAAVVAAGELAALRSSRGGDAVAEIPSASSGREADEALRQQVSVLEAELRRARAEQATASATVSAERQQLRQLQVEEDLALRQAREEARQAREKLTSSEANISVFEEWQRRLVAEVEAERSEGDQRAQRLRQELRRLEQDKGGGSGSWDVADLSNQGKGARVLTHIYDSDEASARQRVEMRRKDQQLAELEKELRQSQRLLAAKEAELSDVQHLHEARLRREETTLTTRSRESAEWEAQLKVKMNHLDDTSTNTGGPLDGMGAFGERNCIELLGGENLQREEVHGKCFGRRRPSSKVRPSLCYEAPGRQLEVLHRRRPEARRRPHLLHQRTLTANNTGQASSPDAQAALCFTKMVVWPGKTQQPDAPQEGHEDEKGLLELVQKKRRQLKKQRAALMVEMEHWRSDVTSGRRPKAEKNQRLATVLEGLRETKAVERTLLSLHWPQKDVDAGRHYNFVPATREAYGHTSPRQMCTSQDQLQITGGSSSTIPFISRAMPYSARASRSSGRPTR
eukprot:g27129.t1